MCIALRGTRALVPWWRDTYDCVRVFWFAFLGQGGRGCIVGTRARAHVVCQIDGRCQCVKEFEVVRTLMVWLSMMTVRERRGERERGGRERGERERRAGVSIRGARIAWGLECEHVMLLSSCYCLVPAHQSTVRLSWLSLSLPLSFCPTDAFFRHCRSRKPDAPARPCIDLESCTLRLVPNCYWFLLWIFVSHPLAWIERSIRTFHASPEIPDTTASRRDGEVEGVAVQGSALFFSLPVDVLLCCPGQEQEFALCVFGRFETRDDARTSVLPVR